MSSASEGRARHFHHRCFDGAVFVVSFLCSHFLPGTEIHSMPFCVKFTASTVSVIINLKEDITHMVSVNQLNTKLLNIVSCIKSIVVVRSF